MIESLRNHTINTLTELCRIERVAMASEGEEMNAFQGPLAVAWDYYVNSNQLLLELRGLTRNYPASSSLVEEAKRLVSADPGSGQSWNLAWLCLVKIRDAYVDSPPALISPSPLRVYPVFILLVLCLASSC